MAIEDVVRKYVHENDSVVVIHGAGNSNVVMVVVVGMVVVGRVVVGMVVGMVVGRVVVGMVADGGRENDPGKETTMAHATPPHPPPPPPPTTTTRLQRDQRGCCN